MPIPQSSEQYNRIPANLRQRLLELYGNINPVVFGITLAPHGSKSTTWRLRWRTSDGQYSLSVGSDPQVIEAVRNLLAEWKSDGIAFLLSEFGNEGQIPYQYLGRIELMRRHREEEQRQPHYIHRTMRPYVPMPMDETTRQRLHELPQALLDQLLGLHKLIKVLGVKFHFSKRPGRATWVLRWRELDRDNVPIQRSYTLRLDDAHAPLIRELLQAWRNWDSPLQDLLPPDQAALPEPSNYPRRKGISFCEMVAQLDQRPGS